MSGALCSLLTRADEASSALSLRVKNNGVYPGEAENWLYMKRFAWSFETGWIFFFFFYLREATEVSRIIIEFDQNAVDIPQSYGSQKSHLVLDLAQNFFCHKI